MKVLHLEFAKVTSHFLNAVVEVELCICLDQDVAFDRQIEELSKKTRETDISTF